jgi:hypothetical protein
MKRASTWCVCVMLAGAAGCGPAPVVTPPHVATFPADALLSVDTTSGLHIDVRAEQQPPPPGVWSFEYTIAKDSVPQTGLTFGVKPFMPQMGHGPSVVPTVVEVGHGVYRIDEVDLFMSGAWELRTTFTGSVSDTTAPAFTVPDVVFGSGS